MNPSALFRISYGLYLLTVSGERDNGCIINTFSQVTSVPSRISVCVSKKNRTHDLLLHSGIFCVSVLSVDAPFALFQRFGYHSGRNIDKFADFSDTVRTQNGLLRLTRYANAYVCGKVFQTVDVGTHTLFIADLTEAETVGEAESLTYAYYQKNIKPKPTATVPDGKTVYRCRICGYEYEGKVLPSDFICPICKHGVQDFEKMESTDIPAEK